MGLLDRIRSPGYAGGLQRPWDKKFPAVITGIEEKGDRKAIVSVDYFTGDETPWQGPRQDEIKTIIPDGVRPQVGQRVIVGSGSSGMSLSNNPRPILWDEPEPELPPMQFPAIPGGDDPQVMREHLEGLVESGALPQEGLERASEYLERGGWPPPPGAGAA
jgi:hypothetical protein